MTFAGLFRRGDSRRKLITVFLALLELCRLGEVTFQQQDNFGPLWLFPGSQLDEVRLCNNM